MDSTTVRNGMPPAEASHCQGRRIHAHELGKRLQSLCDWLHLHPESCCAPVISVKAEYPKLAHMSPKKSVRVSAPCNADRQHVRGLSKCCSVNCGYVEVLESCLSRRDESADEPMEYCVPSAQLRRMRAPQPVAPT